MHRSRDRSTQESAPPRAAPKMFETRSQSWQDAGLGNQIAPGSAKRARWESIVLIVLFAGIVVLYESRHELIGTGPKSEIKPGLETLIQVVTVIALLIVGWAIARDLGRGLGPILLRRMQPATAGTMGFVVRLLTLVLALIVALSVVGVEPAAIVGVAGVTAIILGLAAQQTLGNFFAGTVLISARPFRVGDRVRLQGGVLAGQIEGVVSSLGLLYTTFAVGEDSVMVPNSVVLGVAVRPVREPDAVSMRARLAPGMTPAELQELLDGALRTPLRGSPRITLEELEDGCAVVQIAATPQRAADGRLLASELLATVAEHTGDGSAASAQQAPERDKNAADGEREPVLLERRGGARRR
jgi:small-conductance mechanosensitive channel